MRICTLAAEELFLAVCDTWEFLSNLFGRYFPNHISFPRTAITNYQKHGRLKQQKFILTVLEVRSPKSRCRAQLVPSDGSEEDSVLCLFPSFWCLLAVFGILWHVATSSTQLHPYLALFSVCFSLFSPLYIRTPVIGLRAPLIQYNLIFTQPNVMAKTLFPNNITF